MANINTKRLQRELQDLTLNSPQGIRILDATDSLHEWIIELNGAPDSIYNGETFQLKFRFNSEYPIDSPEVTFIIPHVPKHPHIYSNGHICLSILYDHWTPALTIGSVCLSIQSMLSSCSKKELPPDNQQYLNQAKFFSSPKQAKWNFHDSTV